MSASRVEELIVPSAQEALAILLLMGTRHVTFRASPLFLWPPALSGAANALLGGNDLDGSALVAWLESLQKQKLLPHASLSDLDSMVTPEEVSTNVEMLLAIEDDSDAADRLFSGSGVRAVAERAIG